MVAPVHQFPVLDGLLQVVQEEPDFPASPDTKLLVLQLRAGAGNSLTPCLCALRLVSLSLFPVGVELVFSHVDDTLLAPAGGDEVFASQGVSVAQVLDMFVLEGHEHGAAATVRGGGDADATAGIVIGESKKTSV